MAEVLIPKEKNWALDDVQFARLIAAMEACGWIEGEGLDDVAETMNLTTAQVRELVDRAQAKWDAIKDQTEADAGEPQQLVIDFEKDQ